MQQDEINTMIDQSNENLRKLQKIVATTRKKSSSSSIICYITKRNIIKRTADIR
ncbi:hypothetical protein QW060_25375 [Myroides ceti]|uniref:t-SNARE coiled-coil homology domain-containing protein n=1 Tax=Paenimyroides ceti TaxID=395087 RepID=A0ABT8D170_9FLAO|nr:hypothetical protein [Paenimyroides ceti]MDN3710204.1 hypothetical protein [Paenimyroides ceti]